MALRRTAGVAVAAVALIGLAAATASTAADASTATAAASSSASASATRTAPAARATPAAQTDLAAQTELADRYAPVIQLADSGGRCGGEPFEPTDVDAILDNPDVALRGPWNGDNLITVAPTASDLAKAPPDYYLDFPGNALSPGCSYAKWAARTQSAPTVYAHVVTQDDEPGELALQYWFFYLFNDFNDLHEGDWEMIQVNFHADTAAQALTAGPYETGYSQHEGAERAAWGSKKLQLVDGTHPVVYPALGSHANYYSAHLYLGSSAAQGVGCDDTLGPSRELRPRVKVVAQSPTQYLQEFPWLAYHGRWGERHQAFANGPNGPTDKPRWTEPFTWEDTSWHGKAFAIPDGGLLGHNATSFFCSAVATGSGVLNAVFANPGLVLLVGVLLVFFVFWLASRTHWTPAIPFRVRRRRDWGTLITSALRLYASQVRVFGGIGLLFVPLGLLSTGVQYLLFDAGGFSPLVHVVGKSNAAVQMLVDGIGTVLTLVGLTAVQAATAYAVCELDEGRPVTARAALVRALRKGWTLLGALVIAALVIGLLSLTVFAVVVSAYLIVRWSLLAQATMIGDGTTAGPLRQSMRITRGHFWRTASVTVFASIVCLLIGPLVGTALLFATNASFTLLNMVSALIDAALSPLIAITTTYLYFDLEVRKSLPEGDRAHVDVLPAEI